MFRYVDSLAGGIDSYLAGDVQLTWQPKQNLDLSVVGQNLFAGKHPELVLDGLSYPTEVEPGVYAAVAWRR
jgi:hypothetical protein